MFSIEDRDAARAFILEMASEDIRVTAGAIVGSFARRTEDRWSDLDLTFGVADDVPISDVVSDWTARLESARNAVALWEGRIRDRTYCVYLLPGLLQIDLSFMAASRFAAAGPAFTLLFGEAGPRDVLEPSTPAQIFGWGVIQAIHGRRCIDRKRYWQAEQAIGKVRECALSLACKQHGLEPKDGRGFDYLPPHVLAAAASTIVASAQPDPLRAALMGAVQLLLSQSTDVGELASRTEAGLHALSDTVSM